MTRYAHDGNTKVQWVPDADGIADKSAPTVAEITAGTDISGFIPPDGVDPNPSQNMVNSFSLAEKFDGKLAGTWGADLSLIFFRDNASDTAWELFEHSARGFFVVRRGVDVNQAWAAADKVEVWPVSLGQSKPVKTTRNEEDRFTLECGVPNEPDLKAVVAA